MKTNGFRIIVGREKGSGCFEYFLGSKKQAQQKAEKMKEGLKLMFKQELVTEITPVYLTKCKMCQKYLCEDNDIYCLKCEDMLNDAQIDAVEEREVEI